MTKLNIKRFSYIISTLTALTTSAIIGINQQQAKADLFCLPWETGCKVDGQQGSTTTNPYMFTFKNNCDEAIDVTLQYIPYQESEWDSATFTVEPGSQRGPILSSNGYFYSSADSGSHNWPRAESKVSNRKYTRSFSCNNTVNSPVSNLGEGTLIKGSGDAVYVIRNGKRSWIPSAASFEAQGYRWEDIQVISDEQLKAIPVYRGNIRPGDNL